MPTTLPRVTTPRDMRCWTMLRENDRVNVELEEVVMGRTGMFIALILAFGLACSSCRNNTDSASGTGDRISQKADENQMNPQPREKVQQGGRLVWPSSLLPANFNYHQLDGTLLDGHMMIASALPALFKFDAAGTPTYDPD